MWLLKIKNQLEGLKIKPTPTHKLRTTKKESSTQMTDTTQKSRTHIVTVLNTTNTICGENCVYSWVQE